MSEDLGPVIRAILVAVPWVGVWHLTRMAGARPRTIIVIVAGAIASIVVIELGMQRRLPVAIPIGALFVPSILI